MVFSSPANLNIENIHSSLHATASNFFAILATSINPSCQILRDDPKYVNISNSYLTMTDLSGQSYASLVLTDINETYREIVYSLSDITVDNANSLFPIFYGFGAFTVDLKLSNIKFNNAMGRQSLIALLSYRRVSFYN